MSRSIIITIIIIIAMIIITIMIMITIIIISAFINIIASTINNRCLQIIMPRPIPHLTLSAKN